MSCKSLLYTVNNTTTTIPANGIVPVGNIVRRYGQAIRVNGNSIAVLAPGYYLVSVNLTIVPVAATAITATLNENNVPVPGGTATVTPVATTVTQLTLSQIPVRVFEGGFKTLTVTIDAATDVNVSSITVEKV